MIHLEFCRSFVSAKAPQFPQTMIFLPQGVSFCFQQQVFLSFRMWKPHQGWVILYPAPWIHLCHLIQSEVHIWVHYLRWIYLSLLFVEICIYFKTIPFFLLVFLKMKKTNACFNLGLVIHFVLRAFAVRHTAIVTTATAFSFFGSFPCFLWNFCCW